MLVRLLKRLHYNNLEFKVVSMIGDGPQSAEILQEGVPILNLNIRKKLDFLSKAFVFFVYIKKEKPDIIVAWMYHGIMLSLFALFSGVRFRFIWNIRHTPNKISSEALTTRMIIFLLARLSYLPDLVLYNSYVSMRVHEKMGYVATRSLVIPNGFDLNYFVHSSAKRSLLRKKLKLSSSDILIGTVSRAHPMKNHRLFIEAGSSILKKHANCYFLIAGYGVKNSRHINDAISEYGLERNIFLLDEVSDVTEIMSGLDIFSLTSEWGEGFPNVLAEAMSCSVPCVSTDVGDSGRLLSEFGYIVGANASDISEAYSKIIALPENDLLQLKARLREHIQDWYSIEHISERYLEIFL